MARVLETLSERFAATRRALNDMSERLLALGDENYSLDALLVSKLSGGNVIPPAS